MKIIGVIPARWASTRFEGKVLADIAGKPMLQHVWERVSQSKLLDEVIIACDNDNVKMVAEDFGAKVVLTSKEHTCGTDRIAEVVNSIDVEIVLNIQGDEPLIDSKSIDDLIAAISEDKSCNMATMIRPMTDVKEIENPNIVKVITDAKGNAIYFSRAKIPYERDERKAVFYKHFGIYAFRKKFLFQFRDLPRGKLEEIEKLEQLRVIENGYKIKTVIAQNDSIGVDTPEDLKKIEKLFE